MNIRNNHRVFPASNDQQSLHQQRSSEINYSSQVCQAFLKVIPVRIYVGDKEVNRFVYLDQRSTTFLFDWRLPDELNVTAKQVSCFLSTLPSSVP